MALLTIVAMVALALGATSASAQLSGWKGSVENVNGVKTVNNPATPAMDATNIKLEELWRLGGDTDNEDEFFGVIADIEIDDNGDVYLLDSQLSEVKVYSSDGEFLRSIGREGEGPGEFRRPNAIFFTKNDQVAVVQTIPAKIVLLTKDGEPAGDLPLPTPEDGGFQLLTGAQAAGGNLVLYMGRTQFAQGEGKWSRTDFLVSIDYEGNELAKYASKTNTINMAAAELDDAKWDTIERRWTIGPDGKVYACPSYDNYEVHVWNADGSMDKVIKRDYKHRARTAEEKELWTNMMTHFAKQMPGCEIKIADNCKDVENVYVRDDGSIWVLSSNGQRDVEDGQLGVFDVYNPEGQFVRNVTLQGEGSADDGDLYLFVRDRFYVVTSFFQAAMSAQGVEGLFEDDEDVEPMAVISYKLDRDVLAAR